LAPVMVTLLGSGEWRVILSRGGCGGQRLLIPVMASCSHHWCRVAERGMAAPVGRIATQPLDATRKPLDIVHDRVLGHLGALLVKVPPRRDERLL
jgi:hypothetical protein